MGDNARMPVGPALPYPARFPPHCRRTMHPSASPLSLLKDPSLLKTDGLIDGRWVKGKKRFEVTDPATGRALADVADLTPKDVKAAIAADLRDKVWPLFAAKKIRPVVYKTFPLAQAAQAHTLMEASDHIGKIVLDVSTQS